MSTSKWFTRQALLRAAGISAAVAVLYPTVALGQLVRGIVVDEASGRGLPGTVIVLLDSAGKRLAGVLADDNGRYAIRAMVPGRYGLRAERIGFRAEAPTVVTLGVGQTVELRLVTRPIPVVLGAMRVVGKSPCVARASDGSELSAVWDETRKALYATDLAQQQELFTARVSRYERTLDARTGRVTGYESRQATAVTRSPFVSLPAAQLSANGYVRQSSTETIYYGPDAGVLLSDEFLADHCFRLRDGEGKRAGLIGLSFEPVRGRDKPDITGTLWIDRKSAELRNLEYSYARLPNLPTTSKSEDFGGRIEFHRMPTGAWIVERWVIRMPILVDRGALAARSTNVVPGQAPTHRERIDLVAIREEGGEVMESVARGAKRELGSETASVRGTVFDSTRMAPLSDARVFLDGTQFSSRSGADGSFSIGSVPAGTYAISVMHARFDSLNVAAPSATVALHANEETFAVLGGPSTATIAKRDCTAEERAKRGAMLRGHVRDALSSAPAADAKVSLTWNNLMARTGAGAVGVVGLTAATKTDSAGRYDFCGLPDGVRLTAVVVADGRRSEAVDFLLAGDGVSVLDLVVGKSVVTAAAPALTVTGGGTSASRPRNHAMAEFEHRRRRGNGSYLTRTQIDRMNASRLTDLLRTLPGVMVEPNEGGALIVELRRSKSFTFDPLTAARNDSGAPVPNVDGALAVRKCPAAFQVDGLPVDGGASVDIEIRPETIEAIEVYSPGQVPIEFSARNEQCGLVMIWTRAYAGRPDAAPPGR